MSNLNGDSERTNAGILSPARRSTNPGSLEAGRRRNTRSTSQATSTNGPKPSWIYALLHPKPKPGKAAPPPLRQNFINIIKYSWLNVLLLFIPVSWAVNFAKLNPTLIFVFSFLSIVPLAALLGYATEELALRVGPTLGGLLNATFGNAVELIVAIIALQQNKLQIVQASMLGSFLSNCLLVLGMCFFAGGLRFHEQSYGERIAQQQISLLSLAVFSIVVPTAFVSSGSAKGDINATLAISRATAIVLLICYVAYLVFQLYTHTYLYTLEASKVNAKATFDTSDSGAIGPKKGQRVFRVPGRLRGKGKGGDDEDTPTSNEKETDQLDVPSRAPGTSHENSEETAAHNDGDVHNKAWLHHKKTDGDIDPVEKAKQEAEEEEEEEEVPQLTVLVAVLLLVVVTIITGVTAEFLVSSIDGMTEHSGVNKEFVALILLPLVGNAAEHVTAVTVSVKNKLDLALGVAIGSSIQIFLFVLPFLVVLAWGQGKPLTLSFDVFETIVVTVAIIVVSYAIADGRTNWLEGFVLMILYVIIAIATWFHQTASDTTE